MLVYFSLGLLIITYLLSAFFIGALSVIFDGELADYWPVVVEFTVVISSLFALVSFVKKKEYSIYLTAMILFLVGVYETSFLLPDLDINNGKAQLIMALISFYLSARVYFCKYKYIKNSI